MRLWTLKVTANNTTARFIEVEASSENAAANKYLRTNFGTTILEITPGQIVWDGVVVAHTNNEYTI